MRGALLLIAAALAYGQPGQGSSGPEIHILPVQGNVYMVVGDGGNIQCEFALEPGYVTHIIHALVEAARKFWSNGLHGNALIGDRSQDAQSPSSGPTQLAMAIQNAR